MPNEDAGASPRDTGAGPQAPAPRSRRAILAAALGGVAASVASALGRPADADAASGDALKIGQANFAGGSATRLTATSSGGAFWMTQNGFGSGVRGDSLSGHGGVFTTAHADRFGLYAQQTAGSLGTGAAVRAEGVNNDGVYGTSSGRRGIHGYSDTGAGVRGESNQATGVEAVGWGAGLTAEGASSTAVGVQGMANGLTGIGVFGLSAGGSGNGLYGRATGQFGAGVYGEAQGSAGHGVVGVATAASGNAAGVYGSASDSAAYAAYFEGKVNVVGTLSKSAGSFRIDHPLDPAHKLLQHSFVESPDMKNVYDGVATTDAHGSATVVLPAWFEALNRDFRYQLTPLGSWTQAWIEREVRDNRFTIRSAAPGHRVSWQVTGIRRDAYAQANPIEVEVDKTGNDRGRYLHPLEHGQPASMASGGVPRSPDSNAAP
jgi:hypothetical protein